MLQVLGALARAGVELDALGRAVRLVIAPRRHGGDARQEGLDVLEPLVPLVRAAARVADVAPEDDEIGLGRLHLLPQGPGLVAAAHVDEERDAQPVGRHGVEDEPAPVDHVGRRVARERGLVDGVDVALWGRHGGGGDPAAPPGVSAVTVGAEALSKATTMPSGERLRWTDDDGGWRGAGGAGARRSRVRPGPLAFAPGTRQRPSQRSARVPKAASPLRGVVDR
jgi:hypothetical protein